MVKQRMLEHEHLTKWAARGCLASGGQSEQTRTVLGTEEEVEVNGGSYHYTRKEPWKVAVSYSCRQSKYGPGRRARTGTVNAYNSHNESNCQWGAISSHDSARSQNWGGADTTYGGWRWNTYTERFPTIVVVARCAPPGGHLPPTMGTIIRAD